MAAKGDMNPVDYLAYCLAVVIYHNLQCLV